MDPFLAEIRILPYNFPPKGWAFCNGQLMPISQNTALFSLLGTTYGGDGKSTFGLPDLRGSVPMHPGQAPGVDSYVLGESGGSATVTLLETEIPSHSHFMRAYSQDAADAENPSSSTSLAQSSQGFAYQSTTNTNLVALSNQALAPAGGDQPHNNLMPYLTFNFCIALQGIFPPRS